MERVARSSAAERSALFAETAARLKTTPAVAEADYRAMTNMIFGVVPAFDEIMASLKALEDEINGVSK